jgi:hypothetical protein
MAAPIAAVAAARAAKKGGWFQRVPREILTTPGGMILILLAVTIEIVDWLPLPPIFDQILEIPLEVIFLILFIRIVKHSFKSLILPFIIERIPGISEISFTWLFKMLL